MSIVIRPGQFEPTFEIKKMRVKVRLGLKKLVQNCPNHIVKLKEIGTNDYIK